MSLDDPARHLEVAGQQLARLLRVSVLGEGRESNEVDEQDRYEPSLGRVLACRTTGRGCELGRRGGRIGLEGGAALTAELGDRRVGGAAYRADDAQARAAFGAELAACLVRGAAYAADHRCRIHGAKTLAERRCEGNGLACRLSNPAGSHRVATTGTMGRFPAHGAHRVAIWSRSGPKCGP